MALKSWYNAGKNASQTKVIKYVFEINKKLKIVQKLFEEHSLYIYIYFYTIIVSENYRIKQRNIVIYRLCAVTSAS